MTTTHDAVGAPTTKLTRLREELAAPVDIAVLVYFRIAFGSIMAWEMWRFIDHGWIERYYTDKPIYFKYWPFEWVEPLPDPWITFVFWGTLAAALCVASGFLYRVAAPAMFVGVTYIFLLERARYLNHFYLICLISFLLCFLPLNRRLSVDAWRKPSIQRETAPAWTLWLLRFQIGVPYFFGGIAKLNEDWFRGEPLRAWLSDRTDFPLLGRFFEDEPVVWAMVYGALLLDLFVVFGLLHRKTRPWAFLAAVAFHLMNSRLFNIGIFPWTMMAATAIFFDPSWPRTVIADLRSKTASSQWRRTGFYVGLVVGYLLGGFLPTSFSIWRASIAAVTLAIAGYHLGAIRQPVGDDGIPKELVRARDEASKPVAKRRTAPALLSSTILVALGVWVAVQVLVPLRHYVIPGNVHWTEEGHDFAWHMKLRDKDAVAEFLVVADGQVFEVDNDDHLTSRQERKMSTRPHLMVQYAHYLEDEFEDAGYTEVEVYGGVLASLNGREPSRMVDPSFDLTTESFPWFGHASWILELDEEL